MPTLRIFLCTLPLMCAAGAAGFALGRASVRMPAPEPSVENPRSSFEVVPTPTAPAPEVVDYARWYPTMHLVDSKELLPVTGPAWGPLPGPSWQTLETGGPTARHYNPSALLLPDGRVFLPWGEAAGSQPQDEADVYPKMHWLPSANMGSLATGHAWTDQGQWWGGFESAGPNRSYTGVTILTEGCWLLTGSPSGPSPDPSSPPPSANR